jgi:hypothetical protein
MTSGFPLHRVARRGAHFTKAIVHAVIYNTLFFCLNN